MDQKLQDFLHSISRRTAWIILGSCLCLWLLCLTGVLTPPLSASASVTLFWFYSMLMLVLASGLAAVGAVAALLIRYRRPESAGVQGDGAARGNPEQDRADDQDQVTGLSRILDDPGREGR